MKQKSIVIAVLLSLIILGSSLGRIFLPEWCIFVLSMVFVFVLVYCIEKICIKEKTNAYDLIKNLSNDMCVAKAELLNNINLQKNALLDCLSKNQEGVLKQVKASADFTNEESRKRSEIIVAKICAQTEVVISEFAKELERIDCFEEDVKQILTQIVNQIASFSENSQKLQGQICTNIKENAEKSCKLIDSTSLQVTTLLNTQQSEVKNIIENSSASFVKISKDYKDTLCAKVDELSLQGEVASKAISETLENILQIDGFVKTAVVEHHEILAKKIDLSRNSLSDTITKISTDSSVQLSEKVNELYNFVGDKNGELLEIIKLFESNVCDKVVTNRDTAVNAFNTVLDVVKKQYDTAVKLVLQADKEYSDNVQSAIAEFAKQYKNIENVLVVTRKELSENALSMLHALTEVSNEMVDNLKRETASVKDDSATNISSGVSQILLSLSDSSKTGREDIMEVSDSVKRGNRNLEDKLNSIEKQRVQNTTSIEQKLDQQRLFVDKKLQTIEENYDSLNKCLVNVNQTSLDVKEAIDELSGKNDVDVIIGSFKKLIAELTLEVKGNVSEIENQVLDTKEGQEGINNELKNIQVLLRTLLKSREEQFEGKAAKSPHTTSEAKIVKNTISTDKDIVKEKIEDDKVIHNRVLAKPNPNRQETILDSESGNLVLNSYKDNLLVKSIMKNKHGHVIYEMEYAHGTLIRSKNYDDKGNVNIEQTYYDNGQVHFRNEFTKNGKVSTEFDNNGKRK